jgi:putative oxidoreductase
VSTIGHPLSVTEVTILAARFVLAFVFLFAGIRKVLAGNLGSTVERYRLLPATVVRPVSVTLPIVEATAGFSLAVGFAIAQTSALMGTMLALFSVAVGINLARGRIIPCGCLGDDKQAISWGLVVRNVALACSAFVLMASPPLTLSVDAFFGQTRPPGSPSDAVAIALTVFLALICRRLWTEVQRLMRLDARSNLTVDGRKMTHASVG